MDYKQFFAEVADWIGQANQMAVRHGITSEAFWEWVTRSSAEICDKYNNAPLVIRQMMMLCDWLEEAYDRAVGRKEGEAT